MYYKHRVRLRVVLRSYPGSYKFSPVGMVFSKKKRFLKNSVFLKKLI